jgi:ribosomal protein S18 acetylase RimI-like enzyme
LAAGEPAASGRMTVIGTDAVADMISTEPAHRRRGLGRAVMGALVAEAVEQGATDGLLVASPDGLELYRALGWSVAADMVFARSC